MEPPSAASLDEVLAAARRLPRKAQAELAEQLLHDAAEPGGGAALEMLHGMGEHELVVLAGSIVAPGRQRRMRSLLRKNERGGLRDEERHELDALLQEADRVALLKAKAAYTLAQRERLRTAAA